MKAKQLIRKLQKLVDKHGDFPVFVLGDEGEEEVSFLAIGEDEFGKFENVALIDRETAEAFRD